MISTLTGSGTGPISGYIAQGRNRSRFLNLYSYRKNTLLPSLLGKQPTDATDDVQSVRWSNGGTFLVLSTFVGLRAFSRTGAAFTSLTIPSNFNTIYGDAAISADGSYIASVGNTSPYGRIWFNNAGTLSALTNIGTVDTVTRAVALTSNGSHAAFLGGTSPTFLRIKVRSGSGNSAIFTDMTLASQPASGASGSSFIGGLAFSPDNTYLAVSPNAATSQTIYKWDAATSTYERLATPFVGALPDSTVYGCAWSADGDSLAIATHSKTFFYERSGDTFTSVFNVNGGYRGNFHPSGNFYVTGNGSIFRKNFSGPIPGVNVTFSSLPGSSTLSSTYRVSATPALGKFQISTTSGGAVSVSNTSSITPGVSIVTLSTGGSFVIQSVLDGVFTVTPTTNWTLVSSIFTTTPSYNYATAFSPYIL